MSLLLNTWFPGNVFLKGQSPTIVCSLLFGLVALILWVIYSADLTWCSSSQVIFAAALLLWSLSFTLDVIHRTPLNYTFVLIPILLTSILLKPPTDAAVKLAARTLAWGTVVIVLLDQTLSLLFGNRNGIHHEAIHTLPLGFGADSLSWSGPFEYYSFAGMAGAYLFIFALSRVGIERVSLAAFGFLMVLYAGQATAVFGVLAGIIVFALYSRIGLAKRLSSKLKTFATVFSVILLLLASIAVNPSLSGRWEIYREFLKIWIHHPIFGAGIAGVQKGVAQGLIPEWIHDGHNVVMDYGAKYGVLVVVLFIALMVLAFRGGATAAQSGRPVGLALVTAYISMGLLESLSGLIYLSYASAWFFLAILLSQARIETVMCQPREEISRGRFSA